VGIGFLSWLVTYATVFCAKTDMENTMMAVRANVLNELITGKRLSTAKQ